LEVLEVVKLAERMPSDERELPIVEIPGLMCRRMEDSNSQYSQ